MYIILFYCRERTFIQYTQKPPGTTLHKFHLISGTELGDNLSDRAKAVVAISIN